MLRTDRILLIAFGIVAALVLTGTAAAEPDPADRVVGGAAQPSGATAASHSRLFSSANPIPDGYSRSLVDVKFIDGTPVRLSGGAVQGLPPAQSAAFNAVLQRYGVQDVEPMFTLTVAQRGTLQRRGRLLSRVAPPDLSLWVRLPVPQGANTEGLLQALAILPVVAVVAPARLPALPPAVTPDFTGSQGYLTPATDGIDAQYAWTVPGGTGAGIKVTDIEYSWNQSHEDLTKLNGLPMTLAGGDAPDDPFADNNHGTAVMGELIADRNSFGVTGIAFDASPGLAPANTVNLGYNLANAIILAAASSSPGDVILIEQQTPVCGLPSDDDCSNCGPSEDDGSVFTAIQLATLVGVTVVEAAGNGGVDLDSAVCGTTFDRTVNDSGAIIVGAGASPGGSDRQRLGFSSFGSRLDVQGWGQSVQTTGYGGYSDPDDPGNPNKFYTSGFNGTSSASPIVTGAVADLQGIAVNQLGGPLTPGNVRDILVATGSPQLGDTSEHIGPRPNLRAAIAAILSADLSIEKTASPEVTIAGEEIFYTITVTNNGPNFAPDVVVTDTLPVQLIYLGDTDACVEGPPDTLVCSVGDLDVGESVSFTIKARVPFDTVALESDGTLVITNTAVVGSGVPDPDLSNNTATAASFVQEEADLKVTKLVKPDGQVRAGQVFSYTIYVDNYGPSSARNVSIRDELLSNGAFELVAVTACPEPSQFVAPFNTGACLDPARVDRGPIFGAPPTGGETMVFDLLEPLEPLDVVGGGRWIIQVFARANQEVSVNNLVTVFTRSAPCGIGGVDSCPGTPDPNPANNMAMQSLDVTSVANLVVTKSAEGEEQQVNQPGLMFNNAIFGQFFPTAPNYFVSTRVTAGRRIHYQIRVTNSGPSIAENVVTEDRLPAGLRYYQGSLIVEKSVPNGLVTVLPTPCETGTPGESLDRMVCGLGTLVVGQSAFINFVMITDASLEPGTVLENDVRAASDEFDPINTNNYAFTHNTVLAAADMGIAKSAVGEVVTSYNAALRRFIVTDTANQVTAGKVLRYQLQVQNNGPSDGRNVTIQENLPAVPVPGPVTFLSATGASCRPDDVNQQLLFCDLGDMEAGARETFDLYVLVDPAVPAGTLLTNTATVLHSGSNVVPPGAPPAIPGVDPTRPITWDPCLACGPVANANVATNTTTVGAVADVFVHYGLPEPADLPPPPPGGTTGVSDNVITTQVRPAQAVAGLENGVAGNERRYLVTFGNFGPSVARTVAIQHLLDFKQAGILGEAFLRCEPVDPDDRVACASGGGNLVNVSAFQLGNEVILPGSLNPGDQFSYYLVTRLDSGYVLDADNGGTIPAGAAAKGFIAQNQVSITTTTTDFRTANNTDRQLTLVRAEADLAIAKTDIFGTDPANGFLQCDPVARGGTITYSIVVTNRGPSDAAQVLVVDQLPLGLVLDPALVTIVVSEGQVLDLNGPAPGLGRDDGRIEVLVGNDPNNSGVAQLGRLNAPGTPGAGPVTITITALVPTTTPCGTVFTNVATVATRQNDTLWPPAAQPFPGLDGGPRTPTLDPVLVNNAASETTTVRCPGIRVRKTVSFDGTCPGQGSLVINQTAQPVTFCFEITNTGDTFLDNIIVTDIFETTTQGPVNVPIACSPITSGADPNLPVAPGETVTCSVTIDQLLSICACGVNFNTVTVTGTPVNSGRTVFPCLPLVTDTDERNIEVPCAGVDFRIQLPVIDNQVCQTWIQVQNVGDADTKAMLVFWGEPGACEPQAAGPLKIECSGLLKPGSAWSFAANQVPKGAHSAVAYSLNATATVLDLEGNRRPFADVACGALFRYIVGDWERWQAFDLAYRLRGVWRSPFDPSGLHQVVLDFGANTGEPLAIVVNRKCPDPVDPNVVGNAAYTGISSDQEGARDPVSGSFTSYAPLIFAQRAGLNTMLWIQNSGTQCTSLEIWFKAQDNCLRAILGDVLTLAPGETIPFDPNTVVGPDWIGSAWIRSTQPLGIIVDTYGANHFTSYEGVPGDVSELAFTYGDQVAFAPLVYNQMQGWDTAIQVQNHSGTTAAKVKVYFLDNGGGVLATIVDWICPRGSQSFFLPVIGGLPGNWVGSARIESQEWWTPGSPAVDAPYVSAVVMLEKWTDPARTSRREAIAYNGLGECYLFDWQIGSGAGGTRSGSAVFAVPLLMKEYNGITTELAITNLVPKPGFTDFAIYIYDQNGMLDFVCEKLTEKQVEYINLATWGYVNPRFNGSAVVSAVFWEHDVFGPTGNFVRNLVGLGGVAVERVGGVNGGPDVPGDESKAFEAFPVFNFFMPMGIPSCPGIGHTPPPLTQ